MQQLQSTGSELREQFLLSLGLQNMPTALRVLRFLVAEGTLPRNLVTPDFLPGLTISECDASVEFLSRMGCIDQQGDEIQVSPIVSQLASQE